MSLINPPYHPSMSKFCTETEWAQLSVSAKTLCLRKWGIQDMNILIQCILWPTDNKKILLLKPFHEEMIQLYMACIREDIPHKEILYLIPRFHLKTQLITTAGTIWVLLNDPEETILVNSKGLDLAERIVGGAIRPIFCHNTLFRQCYQEWCPPDNLIKSWGTQSKLIVENRMSSRKEPSVLAGSFDAPKTGDHFGVIVNDDPHDQTNITTIDQIEKVKEGWKAQGPLGDGERTKRIYVATRWHFADVNDMIMSKRAPKFYSKFIEKKLIPHNPLANIEIEDKCAVYLMDVWANDERTDVIWPEKEPVENIKDYREQWGSYFFSCQMENDPVPPEDRSFNPDDFRYYHKTKELDKYGRLQEYYVCGEEKVGKDESGSPVFKVRKIPVAETTIHMTVDPAFGIKPHNDYVGIVIAAHWVEPKSKLRWIVVLKTVRQKMTTSNLIRNIEKLAAEYKLNKVHIEYHGLQGQILEQATTNAKWLGRFKLEMVPIRRMESPVMGKARITRLMPYYESHRIWHPKSIQNGELEQELLGFVGGMSRGQSDDLADAMSDQCDIGQRRKNSDSDKHEDFVEYTENWANARGNSRAPWKLNNIQDLWKTL